MASTSPQDLLVTACSAPRVVVASDSQVDTQHLTQADFDVLMLPGRSFASPVLANKREFAASGVINDEHQFVIFDPQPFTSEEYGRQVVSSSSNPTVSPPFSPIADTPEDKQQYQQAVDAYKAIKNPISSAPFLLKVASTRATLHFNPKTTVVGIVTCGGLCPGLNDVIRSLTLSAHGSYKVKKVLGFRYGYWGLSKEGRSSAIELTPQNVGMIHRQGGTMLGSSRGSQSIDEMVDTLKHYGVSILFTAGGDGTQKGSLAIEEECRRRGLDIAIVGIPKTIDSDISISHRTFGFETAVEESVRAIRAAYSEASSQEYGIGVVTLMGRHSGFIAAQATIASAQANICLIPEVKTTKETFLRLLKTRFRSRKYCVVVVAEGFGQDWAECKGDHGVDASGNKKNAHIGEIVKATCNDFLKSDPKYKLSTVKYIDPSYMIRACPANPSDAAFCTRLSTLAVHEAMAGNTGCVISQWFGNFVLVPAKVCVSTTRKVSPQGQLWRQVRDLTVDNDQHIDFEMHLHDNNNNTDDDGEPTDFATEHSKVITSPTEAPFVANGDLPRQRVIVIRDTCVTNTSVVPNGSVVEAATQQRVVLAPQSETFLSHTVRTVATGAVTAAIVLAAMKFGALHKKQL